MFCGMLCLMCVLLSLWPCNSLSLNSSTEMTLDIFTGKMAVAYKASESKSLARQFTHMVGNADSKKSPQFKKFHDAVVELFPILLDPLWFLHTQKDGVEGVEDDPFNRANTFCFLYATFVTELLSKVKEADKTMFFLVYPVMFEARWWDAKATEVPLPSHFATAVEIKVNMGEIIMIDVAGTQFSNRWGGFVGSPDSININAYRGQTTMNKATLKTAEDAYMTSIRPMQVEIDREVPDSDAQKDKISKYAGKIREMGVSYNLLRKTMYDNGSVDQHYYDPKAFNLIPFNFKSKKYLGVSDANKKYPAQHKASFDEHYSTTLKLWLEHKDLLIAYAKQEFEKKKSDLDAEVKGMLEKFVEATDTIFSKSTPDWNIMKKDEYKKVSKSFWKKYDSTSERANR